MWLTTGIPEEPKDRAQHNQPAEIDELYRQLGQVVAERDWLKKSRRVSVNHQESLA